jgi:hypothetical protein
MDRVLRLKTAVKQLGLESSDTWCRHPSYDDDDDDDDDVVGLSSSSSFMPTRLQLLRRRVPSKYEKNLERSAATTTAVCEAIVVEV